MSVKRATGDVAVGPGDHPKPWPGISSAMRYLEPHSAEWFAALESDQPVQATLTRRHVAAAGTVEICSLCGSASARDYWVVARKTDPSPVPTLRLCADCVGVRTTVFGQKLLPINPEESR